MRKDDIQIGGTYSMKVSGRIAPVKIIAPRSSGKGWIGKNLTTGRTIEIYTAARCRRVLPPVVADVYGL